MEENLEITDIVIGLDIGTTKVVAMIGAKVENGKVNIIGWGNQPSFGVKNGAVINVIQTSEAIKEAMKKAQEMAKNTMQVEKFELSEVYVGVASQHVKMQTESITDIRNNEEMITDQELRKIERQIKQVNIPPGHVLLQTIPRVYEVDGSEDCDRDNIIGMYGNQLKVTFNVITANGDSIRNIKRSVELAGLKVADFVLEPWASSVAVLNDEDKKAGVVLVDIGGGTTDVAVFYANEMYNTSVVPIAGNAITNDVKSMCGTLYAESLKEQFGKLYLTKEDENVKISLPGLRGKEGPIVHLKDLSECIGARVKEIFVFVKEAINNAQTPSDCFGGGLVLTGGGAKLKEIVPFTQYIMTMDVRIGDPSERLVESPISQSLKDPIYATAVGLLLYGIDFEEKRKYEYEEGFSGKEEYRKEEQDNVPEVEEQPSEEAEKQEELPQKDKKNKKMFAGGLFDKLKKLLDNEVDE